MPTRACSKLSREEQWVYEVGALQGRVSAMLPLSGKVYVTTML